MGQILENRTTEELQRLALLDTATCPRGQVRSIHRARAELLRRREPLFTAQQYRERLEEMTHPLMELLQQRGSW